MKFTVRFQAPTISMSSWMANLDTRLGKQLEQAAKVWLNATVMSVIPVWGGASRATFIKLASEVNFALTVTGVKSSAGPFIAAGRAGKQLGLQRSTGSVSKGEKPGVYTFTYGTTLFHLVYNEFNDANQSPQAARLFARLEQPGPYNFQEIGKDAFEAYAKDAVDLPSPWKRGTLVIKRIRVG